MTAARQHYKKKPVVITAVRWDGSLSDCTEIIDWILGEGGTARYHESGEKLADPNCPTPEYHQTHNYCPSCAFTTEPEHIAIQTIDPATARAFEGDYIIRGAQGEFYPCKPDIFEQTYEAT